MVRGWFGMIIRSLNANSSSPNANPFHPPSARYDANSRADLVSGAGGAVDVVTSRGTTATVYFRNEAPGATVSSLRGRYGCTIGTRGGAPRRVARRASLTARSPSARTRPTATRRSQSLRPSLSLGRMRRTTVSEAAGRHALPTTTICDSRPAEPRRQPAPAYGCCAWCVLV